jgi:polysaccharide pyruvyl transferase WcaK-like protein
MMTRVAALARSAGTPVAICGAAVREGGTPFGAALLRITGALARDVAVRDRASAKRLSRRARVIGDVAFAHRGVGATDRHTVDASFLVSMRPLANAAEQRLASTLREVAYRLSQRGLAGAFLPMSRGYGASGEDDVEIYDRYLADVMPTSATHLEERPFAELAKAWFELLARQQLILATRLHAAVPSVMCGVPTVAFAYEHKVSETFKQLGLSEYVMDVGASADDVMRVAEAAISESGLRDFANAREIAASQGALVRQTIASLTGRWR